MPLEYSQPLTWPSGQPRSEKWQQGINQSFKAGMPMEEALLFLEQEVNAINPERAVLITDCENIATPRLLRRISEDAGAVLRLKINGITYELACDRWVQLEHNIYALHLALQSARRVVEWGIGDLPTVLGGWAKGSSGPAVNMGRRYTDRNPDAGSEEWRTTLGLGPTATLEDAKAVYRRRAKLVASNEEEMMRLNLAMDEANKALGG